MDYNDQSYACESSGDESQFSPSSSTLTVHYKAVSSLNQKNGATQQEPGRLETEVMIREEACSAILQPATKPQNRCRRSVCWVLACFLFTGVILLGLCIWLLQLGVLDDWTLPPKFTEQPVQAVPAVAEATLGCSEAKPLYPGVDYLNFGYDITRANPMMGSRDPGFARPLWQWWWDKANDTAFTPDCRYTVPAQFQVHPLASSCQPEVKSSFISTLPELEDYLNERVRRGRVNGAADEVNRAADSRRNTLETQGFMTSTLWAQISADLLAGKTVVLTEVTCLTLALMRTQTQSDPAALTPEAMSQLNRLAQQADEDEMRDFFEDYGTHYVKSITFGKKATLKFTSKAALAPSTPLSRDDVILRATTAGLYMLSQANLSIHLSSSGRKIAQDFLASMEVERVPREGLSERWTDESLSQPEPVQIELEFIGSLLSSKEEQGKLQRGLKSYFQKWSDEGYSAEMDVESGYLFPGLRLQSKTAVTIRANWIQCKHVCQTDPLCTAMTSCRTLGADVDHPQCEAQTCWLHRETHFTQTSAHPSFATLVLKRDDLAPVNVQGVELRDGQLLKERNVKTYANCLQICYKLKGCLTVTTVLNHGELVCKLFGKPAALFAQMNDRANTTFLMGVVTNCEADCPTNAECRYGLCICKLGHRFENRRCVPFASLEVPVFADIKIPVTKSRGKQHIEAYLDEFQMKDVAVNEESTTISSKPVKVPAKDTSPTPGTVTKAVPNMEYIRGVLVSKTTSTETPTTLPNGIGRPVFALGQQSKEVTTTPLMTTTALMPTTTGRPVPKQSAAERIHAFVPWQLRNKTAPPGSPNFEQEHKLGTWVPRGR